MRNIAPLINKCIDNDRLAQAKFYRIFYPRLMSVSLRMSPDGDTAKDLLQESFIKIFRGLKTLKGSDEPMVFAWCKRIVNNTIIDHIRKYGKINRLTYGVGVENFNIEFEEYDTTFLDRLYLSKKVVMAAINNLSASYKPVFTMITEGTHIRLLQKD